MAALPPEQIARLALDAGLSGGHAAMAVAVALAESSGDPGAVGDEDLVDAKWGPSIGLWQIRSLHADRGTGRTRDALILHDPTKNARSMAVISNMGMSWTPWSAYKNGAYKAYGNTAAAAVKAAGADLPSVTNPADWSAQAIDSILPFDGITDPLMAVGRLALTLTRPDFWRRVGWGALGLALVVVALVLIARDQLTPKIT